MKFLRRKVIKFRSYFDKKFRATRRIRLFHTLGFKVLTMGNYEVDLANKKRRTREKNKKRREIYGSWFSQKNNKRKKARLELIERDGDRCFWCAKAFGKETPTIDHTIPVSEGGAVSDLSNMRLIHNTCRVARDYQINKKKLDGDFQSAQEIQWFVHPRAYCRDTAG